MSGYTSTTSRRLHSIFKRHSPGCVFSISSALEHNSCLSSNGNTYLSSNKDRKVDHLEVCYRSPISFDVGSIKIMKSQLHLKCLASIHQNRGEEQLVLELSQHCSDKIT